MHAYFRSGLMASAVLAVACGASPGVPSGPHEDSGPTVSSDAFQADISTSDASSLTDAAVADVPTCVDNATCPDASYCAGATCGAPGHCTVEPPVCTASASAVCGCDGHSYNNPCVAAMEGVRVASTGACVTAADAGPAPCRNTTDCATDELCDALQCGGMGACTPRPTGCTMDYAPVCGCDGHTYTNVCAAHSAGVRLDTLGVCGASDAGVAYDGDIDATVSDAATGPGPCTSPADCGSMAYCAGSGCGSPGVCSPRPTVAACPMVPDQVCGCDGSTYGNACLAASAGVRVATTAACVALDGGRMAMP